MRRSECLREGVAFGQESLINSKDCLPNATPLRVELGLEANIPTVSSSPGWIISEKWLAIALQEFPLQLVR
ncbi:hypothetical protein H6G00_02530 [Leptolyngbya sp. FACHB-541]|uniref:hypothetical protein n=1 Tax=Leptolyngbya sp. FACHB-541 TaxID=2692810 RepID=UPI0016861B9C|nr:hypothetical protein [Leptolyngbya sp. FACHB-541]MBD1995509.1 hypothetical protein [Leptolyngbya sp. FACHB-541]